jgi:hypothetical protein
MLRFLCINDIIPSPTNDFILGSPCKPLGEKKHQNNFCEFAVLYSTDAMDENNFIDRPMLE